MIGNAVIDLEYARTSNNWKRQGYLQKIFSSKEQELIFDATDPHQLVWKMWSMKESVYKASLAASGLRQFNPKAFKCSIDSDEAGHVSFGGKIYTTVSAVKDKHIHTYAYPKELNDGLFMKMLKLDDLQSASQEVYASLIASVCKRRKWKIKDLEVRKNALGIPQLHRKNLRISTIISMSHHGNYGSHLSTF